MEAIRIGGWYASGLHALLSKPAQDNTSCRAVYSLVKSLSKEKDVAVRKAIAAATIQELRSYFTSSGNPSAMRRWAGLLLHQCLDLLEGGGKTGDTPFHNSLTHMIREDHEDLKLIAGMIIRKLILAGVPSGDFWQSHWKITAPFPTDNGPAWMEQLQSFVSDLYEKTNYKSTR